MSVLYNRIIGDGTLNEEGGKPPPQFALPATVNWMHALRVTVKDQNVNFQSATNFYKKIEKREMTNLAENTVLEQLFLALHHLSALQKMKGQLPVSDFARLAIMGWYYGVANAASAMIAAQMHVFQEDHAGKAKTWDNAIALPGFAMEPFSWRVSSLIEKTYKQEVERYRSGSSVKLTDAINSPADARGALASYLSGSAAWYAWKAENDLKESKEFKSLKLNNFRTAKAREIKDRGHSRRAMGFLHQALRYRGKANYREALFLAYGKRTEATMENFIDDQAIVLEAFISMAGAFCAKRLGSQLWDEFINDVDEHKSFSVSAATVWS